MALRANVAFMFGAAVPAAASGLADPSSSLAAESLWSAFKLRHGKAYVGEEAERFEIFKDNLAFIEAENAEGHSYTLGVGPFADLTHEEFVRTYASGFPADTPSSGAPHLGSHTWNGDVLPDEVDWTAAGAVTAVKDQAMCGSCWAFSATGALEGAYKIASGSLPVLSEQQFVDCPTGSFMMHGCRGGLMDDAFRWSQDQDLCSNSSYPYEAKGGTCRSTGCEVAIPQGTVAGFKDVGECQGPMRCPTTPEDLKSAVAQQPISVAIEADRRIFQHYTGGVLTGGCGGGLDHGVLVVGYGTDPEGGDYWKVKNSWGPSWGDNGYVRLTQEVGRFKRMGECGILKSASYPVIGYVATVVV